MNLICLDRLIEPFQFGTLPYAHVYLVPNLGAFLTHFDPCCVPASHRAPDVTQKLTTQSPRMSSEPTPETPDSDTALLEMVPLHPHCLFSPPTQIFVWYRWGGSGTHSQPPIIYPWMITIECGP